MSTRSEFFRDALLAALGVCALIALLVVGVLWFSGAFSWLWFARVILAAALLAALVEGIVVLRALGERRVRTHSTGLRRADRTPGCTAAVLLMFVVLGLAFCGALLEWVIEFR